jgi:hypothetical protein
MTALPAAWRSGSSKNVRRLGHLDIPGGGQVVVRDGFAYVGHLQPPHGTSIIDVRDPKRPRLVAEIAAPPAGMSHKARVRDGILFTNSQKLRGAADSPEFEPGLRIFDVSNPTKPHLLTTWRCAGVGVHRFDIDDRYAYLGAELEGYRGRIVVILDLQDPAHPQEVGRWWLPGQWIAGGEEPTWEARRHSCHHPLRSGDRLYVSYWHGGFMILDISDMTKPRLVSHMDWSPPYPCPTHTALRIPWRLADRDVLLCTDEEVGDRLSRWPAAFVWMVDITEERNPVPISTYRGPHDADAPPNEGFGAHQPQEQLYPGDNIIAVTWFAGGLRMLDISDPYAVREVGHYVPEPGRGQARVGSNDVFVDSDRTIYLIDRFNGLEILEYKGTR